MTAAVMVDHLYKDFTLRHNRAFGIKTRFLSVFHPGKRERREQFHALRDITFTVEKGEALGLLGANGSGKSTLLQIIAGILPPTRGKVITNGRVAPLIQLGVGFNPELTGLENIYLNASLYGFQNKEVKRLLDDIIAFSELAHFIDTPLKHYSSGMQMRLGFSVAVHLDPDILLADEILAVGDQAFQDKCHEKIAELRSRGMTLILVSHSPEQVDKFCDQFVRMEYGEIAECGRLPKAVKIIPSMRPESL
jgi:ABC-type polysaccharide/polyol phosphate transport system ATPase subunit